MTQRTRVVAITVSYRCADLTIASLRALSAEQEREHAHGIDVSAVIVDNASGDAPAIASAIAVHGWSSWVTLITAERNGGFAYGNNVALKHVYDSGAVPDYFFLLNPDSEVRPNSIGELVRFLEEHPRAGTAGPSLEGRDGEVWPYAYRFPSWVSEVDSGLRWGLFTRLVADRIVARRMGDTCEEVDWYPGAAMMVRRAVIDELGGMDESYFLYYEETDWCLKVRRAGWSHWYVPTSRVMHIAGQSTGLTGSGTPRLPKYWFESRRRYFAKNMGTHYAVAADLALASASAAGWLKRVLLRRPPGRPHFIGDLLANSAIRSVNRELAPAREFHPERSRTAADAAA